MKAIRPGSELNKVIDDSSALRGYYSFAHCSDIPPHVRECGLRPDSSKVLLVESEILGFGIRNPTNEWNPEFKLHRQRLESKAWNLKKIKAWVFYLIPQKQRGWSNF